MKRGHSHYFLLGLIALFALVVRLSNLDKPSGLWYDEMTLYSIVSKSFPFGMMAEDAHRFLLFPLYFLIYKGWIACFGNSDFVIRLMSVFFDMAALVCAYFAGVFFASCLNKDESKYRIGLFSALLYAVNSSFIYYAQEAKFYSLTFFLINLLIIFWLRMLKNPSNLNKNLFIASSALLLYTDTLQVLLILILQLMTLVYFYKKKEVQEYKGIFLRLLIILLPLLTIMVCNKAYFSGNFDAVVYDNSFVLLLAQNFFSPILVGLQNNVLSYQLVILHHIFSLKWWIFIFFPVIFYIFLLVEGTKKATKNGFLPKIFLAVAGIYLFSHILLTLISDYAVLWRYVLLILLFLLPVAAVGLEKICAKKIGYVFLFLFLTVNLYVLSSPLSAIKIQRPEGYRVLAQLLIQNNVSPKESFILPIRVDLLDKYYKIEGEKFSLYSLTSKKDGNKQFLSSDSISKEFETAVKTDFVDKIPKNGRLILTTDLSICMFSNEQLAKIAEDGDSYKKYPQQFLTLSKLNNNLIKVLSKDMRLEKTIQASGWQVYVFVKQ